MEPLMYGEDLGGFFILKGAEGDMRRVEKGADGLEVAAGILRAQALTYLRGKHGPRDLEEQGGTQAFERGSSFLDSNTSTYTYMDSDTNSSPTHSPKLTPTPPTLPPPPILCFLPTRRRRTIAPPPLPTPLPLDHRGKRGEGGLTIEGKGGESKFCLRFHGGGPDFGLGGNTCRSWGTNFRSRGSNFRLSESNFRRWGSHPFHVGVQFQSWANTCRSWGTNFRSSGSNLRLRGLNFILGGNLRSWGTNFRFWKANFRSMGHIFVLGG